MSKPPSKSAFELTQIDKDILNTLQKGFPISHAPYDDAGKALGISGDELMTRLQTLLDEGYLSRFGPMFDMDEMGGAVELAAMQVPPEQFTAVTDYLNELDEIAHNYQRKHRLNMWFVIACRSDEALSDSIKQIESKTGLTVYRMPKLQTFYINLYLPVN